MSILQPLISRLIFLLFLFANSPCFYSSWEASRFLISSAAFSNCLCKIMSNSWPRCSWHLSPLIHVFFFQCSSINTLLYCPFFTKQCTPNLNSFLSEFTKRIIINIIWFSHQSAGASGNQAQAISSLSYLHCSAFL